MNFQRLVVRFSAAGIEKIDIALVRSSAVSFQNQKYVSSPLSLLGFNGSRSDRIPRYQIRLMNTKPDYEKSELLYEGPMGNLITSLKLFSLSSAFLSTIGLPALMIFRGVDMYTGIHMAMVSTTIAGSIGSTLGLQYIFSPYVYSLESIPIRQCHYRGEAKDMEMEANDDNDKTQSADATNTNFKQGDFLLKATTRSVFATKVEHVFDPETDITAVPPGTIRPFCSFFAKRKPLYIHEHMIEDPTLSQHLFVNKDSPIPKTKNPDPDDEFL